MHQNFICLLSLSTFLLTFKKAESFNRIIGGELANITSYPYQLSLRYYGNHVCGASLLTPTLAISSAHCLSHPGPYSVIGGVSNLLEAGQVAHVQLGLIHPYYDSFINDYDVALLFLATPLPLSKQIQPIKLPSVPMMRNAVGVVSGWGVSDASSYEMSLDLRAVQVPVLEWGRCKRIYREEFTRRMLCAGWMEGGKDACAGDSGGPLVVRGELRGIVSSGVDCAKRGFPGIYTDVYSVLEFIKTNGKL